MKYKYQLILLGSPKHGQKQIDIRYNYEQYTIT